MSQRINISADDETAKKVKEYAVKEDRPDAAMALRLIKEAIVARETAK